MQFLRSFGLLFWVSGLAGVIPAHADQVAAVTGTAEVTDGDGLAIGPVAIRLHGIDSPEAGQSCAQAGGGSWPCDEEASARLAALIDGQAVECEPLDRDAYGRIVARCTAGGVDLAGALAREGLAWAFTRYSADYVAHEAEARAAHAGVWQAETQPPWEYREDRWERAAAEAPDGCPIKGNISGSGEQIYHTPWSRWYSRTRIDVAKGERWFCDEKAAQAAGWRAARSR